MKEKEKNRGSRGRHSKRLTSFLIAFISLVKLYGNPPADITGVVMSEKDQELLIGANVIVRNSDPIIGAITDINGQFNLNLEEADDTLSFSYIGHQTVHIPLADFDRSGKNVVIVLPLDVMDDIVIRASNQSEIENPYALVSAKSIGIEETSSVPGGFNDIARLAQNFAGVQKRDDSSNEVVVRGNAPYMVLWNLEGVEIPNPNHFSEFGTSGGNLSVLNTNTMRQADFYTGAFPANYSNALGAAFDIQLKNGRTDRWHGIGQLGFNGFEFMADGPINRQKDASLFINYRNSNLTLLDKMRVIDFDTYLGVPTFNDFTLKLNLPNTKLGSLSFFGMGGFSDVTTSASAIIRKERASEEAKREAIDEGLDQTYGSRMGVAGINHRLVIGEKHFLNNRIAYTSTNSYLQQDTLDFNYNPHPQFQEDYKLEKFIVSSSYDLLLNKNHQFQVGLTYNQMLYGLNSEIQVDTLSRMIPLLTQDGMTGHQQSYFMWKYTSTNEFLVLNAGMHQQWLLLNNTYSFEPRISARLNLTPAHSLTAAFGQHGQLLPVTEYFRPDPRNSDLSPNRALDFMRSYHFVIGHTWKINDYLDWNMELYYQQLYNIPVSGSLSNSWSMINYGLYEDGGNRTPDLINAGKGRNYGVDLSLNFKEHKGYYGMLTTSLFRSLYEGSDNIWRSTAFDSRFVSNLIFGKRISLGRVQLDLNLKQNWTGGQKYAPILEDISLEQKRTVRDFDRDFTATYPNYYKMDFRIGLILPFTRTTHEMALDLQNVTNRKNILYETYSPALEKIKTVYQLGFIPVFQYKISF